MPRKNEASKYQYSFINLGHNEKFYYSLYNKNIFKLLVKSRADNDKNKKIYNFTNLKIKFYYLNKILFICLIFRSSVFHVIAFIDNIMYY